MHNLQMMSKMKYRIVQFAGKVYNVNTMWRSGSVTKRKGGCI